MVAVREWAEFDARQMIFNEITSGETLGHLNASIKILVEETLAGFSDTIRSLEMQASQIVIQERNMKSVCDERCTHPPRQPHLCLGDQC